MERLTEQSYWNSVHARGSGSPEPPPESRPKASLYRRLVRRMLGTQATEHVFAEYDLWRNILPKFVTPNPRATVLEVGSAPGTNLLSFSRFFGHQPYGVEYTASGVEANQRLFAANGLDPANVIQADFFAESFQASHRDRFDVVFSMGFIEHFTDMETVIAAHTGILKPGGLLIVSIPNLSGMNHSLVQRFAPDLLEIHNLSIMNRRSFQSLFVRPELEQQFCDYQGGMSLLIGADGQSDVSLRLLNLLRKAQILLNLFQRAIVPLNSHWTSHNLLYIGRKR